MNLSKGEEEEARLSESAVQMKIFAEEETRATHRPVRKRERDEVRTRSKERGDEWIV